MTSLPDLITQDEICKALKINRITLYRWRKLGIAPKPVEVGRQKLLFNRAEVELWLKNRKAS